MPEDNPEPETGEADVVNGNQGNGRKSQLLIYALCVMIALMVGTLYERMTGHARASDLDKVVERNHNEHGKMKKHCEDKNKLIQDDLGEIRKDMGDMASYMAGIDAALKILVDDYTATRNGG
ncbi:unnamed protein product [marine sediment metagenome]|uniref:Uncharacterized protein n=1 Tax=marine sediment metagenome TaxID=412755 RepID=X0TXF6_9ZZZZ